MNFLKKTMVVGGVLAAFSLGSALAADDKSPIKIVTNNWTSQVVLSHVVGGVLKAQGVNVEFKSSDTQLQFTAIAAGDMDFQVEVWEGSMHESFQKSLKTGAVDYGPHNAVTREDWWYPSYMNERCPGLPDGQPLPARAGDAENDYQARDHISLNNQTIHLYQEPFYYYNNNNYD
jgi:glycine betaine/proline transport system substrate-binding protein